MQTRIYDTDIIDTKQDKTRLNGTEDKIEYKTSQNRARQDQTKEKTKDKRWQITRQNKTKQGRRFDKIEGKTRLMTRQRTKQGREYFLTLPQNVLLCQDKTKLDKLEK